MGTTLDHGIYLPDEGERNCYDGLAGNWVALDNHLGSTDIHVTINDKQAWNGHIADTTIHVTSADKQAWNGHIADTTIHVTSADKQAWNDHVADTDKHVTASDKQTWNTVTSKANDSDVVHKSGNETINGSKTFAVSPIIYNPDTTVNNYLVLKNPKVTIGSTTDTGSQRVVFQDKNGKPIGSFISLIDSNGWTYIVLEGSSLDSQSNVITRSVRLRVTNAEASLLPSNDNNLLLGSASARWSNIYSVNYYYGNNNIEFSQKFVTTDTTQTIIGQKIFLVTPYIYNIDRTANTPALFLRNSKVTKGGSDTGNQSIFFTDKDNKTLSKVFTDNSSNGTTSLNLKVGTLDDNNADVSAEVYLYVAKNGTKGLQASADNDINLGRTNNRWKDTCTCLINGLEPSSLSLPSGNASDVIDISSYITALNGTFNSYTVPANGWISIAVVGTAIAIVSSSWSDSRLRESSGNVRMLYPVLKNETLNISVVCTTLVYARFIPCQGNV